tara:strand:+ start:202 stop:1338 length:1137 start_codon:yes stop_codon:yes gene_type:complete
LKYCTRCVLPETHETIIFDENGVCNVCLNNDKKNNISWDKKLEDFKNLVAQYKNKNEYDCIVPFSGGKDSTFTLYKLVNDFKLKPLVVSFNHGFMRKNLLENNNRTFEALGIDHLSFKPNWKLVQLLMKESLIRKGDFCWHCHTGIFAYPMRVAVEKKIPLVIWGEPSSEYTAYYSYDGKEEVDEKRFNRFVNLGISSEDMYGMIKQRKNTEWVKKSHFLPFTFPSRKEMMENKIRSICLGSYIPWNVRSQSKIISEKLGWKGDKVEGVPGNYSYEKIECSVQGVRDYLKYIKRGYGRTAHLVSIDIRNNRLDRETGLGLVNDNDGKKPASLKRFLKYINTSEQQFNEIASEQKIHPYNHEFSSTIEGEPLPDENLYN